MLETLVATILSRYLCKYVEGIKAEHLKLSFLSGEVQLESLSLKASALDDLDLPIIVKSGHLKKLHLSVPWSNLKEKPVILRLSGVHLLARRSHHVDLATHKEKSLNTKRTALFFDDLLRKTEEERDKDSKEKEKQEKNEGFQQRLINQVVDKLQLYIDDVHVRFEDELEGEPSTSALGLILHRIHVQSVSKGWKVQKAAEVGDAKKKGDDEPTLKLANLEGFAMYWQPDSTPYKSAAEMEAIFSELQQHNRQGNSWIIHPINGRLRLALRKMSEVTELVPKTMAHLLLEDINFSLSQQQYSQCVTLANALSVENKRRKYLLTRPHGSPSSHPRLWWRFARECVTRELREQAGRFSWQSVKRMKEARNKYIGLYSKKKGGAVFTDADSAQLQALEDELDFSTTTFLRSLALSYSRLTSAQAAKQKQQPKPAEPQPQEGGGWWARWWGKSEVQAVESEVKAAVEDITPQVWAEIYEAVGSEQPGQAAAGAPNSQFWDVQALLSVRAVTVSILPDQGEVRQTTIKLDHILCSYTSKFDATSQIRFQVGQLKVLDFSTPIELFQTLAISRTHALPDAARRHRETVLSPSIFTQQTVAQLDLDQTWEKDMISQPHALLFVEVVVTPQVASAGSRPLGSKVDVVVDFCSLDVLLSRPSINRIVSFFTKPVSRLQQRIHLSDAAVTAAAAVGGNSTEDASDSLRYAQSQLALALEDSGDVAITVHAHDVHVIVPTHFRDSTCSILEVHIEQLTASNQASMFSNVLPTLADPPAQFYKNIHLEVNNTHLLYSPDSRSHLPIQRQIDAQRGNDAAPLLDAPLQLACTIGTCLARSPLLPKLTVHLRIPGGELRVTPLRIVAFVEALLTAVEDEFVVDDSTWARPATIPSVPSYSAAKGLSVMIAVDIETLVLRWGQDFTCPFNAGCRREFRIAFSQSKIGVKKAEEGVWVRALSNHLAIADWDGVLSSKPSQLLTSSPCCPKTCVRPSHQACADDSGPLGPKQARLPNPCFPRHAGVRAGEVFAAFSSRSGGRSSVNIAYTMVKNTAPFFAGVQHALDVATSHLHACVAPESIAYLMENIETILAAIKTRQEWRRVTCSDPNPAPLVVPRGAVEEDATVFAVTVSVAKCVAATVSNRAAPALQLFSSGGSLSFTVKPKVNHFVCRLPTLDVLFPSIASPHSPHVATSAPPPPGHALVLEWHGHNTPVMMPDSMFAVLEEADPLPHNAELLVCLLDVALTLQWDLYMAFMFFLDSLTARQHDIQAHVNNVRAPGLTRVSIEGSGMSLDLPPSLAHLDCGLMATLQNLSVDIVGARDPRIPNIPIKAFFISLGGMALAVLRWAGPDRLVLVPTDLTVYVTLKTVPTEVRANVITHVTAPQLELRLDEREWSTLMAALVQNVCSKTITKDGRIIPYKPNEEMSESPPPALPSTTALDVVTKFSCGVLSVSLRTGNGDTPLATITLDDLNVEALTFVCGVIETRVTGENCSLTDEREDAPFLGCLVMPQTGDRPPRKNKHSAFPITPTDTPRQLSVFYSKQQDGQLLLKVHVFHPCVILEPATLFGVHHLMNRIRQPLVQAINHWQVWKRDGVVYPPTPNYEFRAVVLLIEAQMFATTAEQPRDLLIFSTLEFTWDLDLTPGSTTHEDGLCIAACDLAVETRAGPTRSRKLLRPTQLQAKLTTSPSGLTSWKVNVFSNPIIKTCRSDLALIRSVFSCIAETWKASGEAAQMWEALYPLAAHPVFQPITRPPPLPPSMLTESLILMLPRESLTLNFVADDDGEPLVRIILEDVNVRIDQWSGPRTLSLTCDLVVNTYNRKLQSWEPFVEQLSLSLKDSLKFADGKYDERVLVINSDTTVLLNVSPVGLAALKAAQTEWMRPPVAMDKQLVATPSTPQELASRTSTAAVLTLGSSAISSTFMIRNDTPVGLWYGLSVDEYQTLHEVPAGVQERLIFPASATEAQLEGEKCRLLLQLEGQFLTMKDLPLRHMGTHLLCLTPDSVASPIYCMYTICFHQGNILISVKSAANLENCTNIPLEVQYSSAAERGTSLKVEPHSTCSFPLLPVQSFEVAVRPNLGATNYNFTPNVCSRVLMMSTPDLGSGQGPQDRSSIYPCGALTSSKRSQFFLMVTVDRFQNRLGVTVHPTVRITNLFGVNMEWRALHPRTQEVVTSGLLPPGESDVSICCSPESHVFVVFLESYGQSKPIQVNAQERRTGTSDLKIFGNGSELNAKLTVEEASSSQPHVSLTFFCEFWFVNNVGLPVMLKQGRSLLSGVNPAAVKGWCIPVGEPREWFQLDSPLYENPVMFCPGNFLFMSNDDGIYIAVANSQWSQQPLKLARGNMAAVTRVLFPPLLQNDNSAIDVSVTFCPAPPPFTMTTRILLQPQYILVNRTCSGSLMYYRQYGAKAHVYTLPHSGMIPLFWPSDRLPPLLQLRVGTSRPVKWCPSFCILPDTPITVKMRPVGGDETQFYFVRVQVHTLDSTNYVVFTDDQDVAPEYRIDNLTDFPVVVRQLCEAPKPVKPATLDPHTTMLYAWDCPSLDHSLQVSVQGVQCEVTLDTIQDIPGVAVPGMPGKVLRLEVTLALNLKVLSVSVCDRSSSVATVEELSGNTAVSFRCMVSLHEVHVSFMDDHPQEVLLMRLQRIEVEHTASPDECQYELTVGYMQVDNQLYDALFVVAFQPSIREPRDVFLTLKMKTSNKYTCVKYFPFMAAIAGRADVRMDSLFYNTVRKLFENYFAILQKKELMTGTMSQRIEQYVDACVKTDARQMFVQDVSISGLQLDFTFIPGGLASIAELTDAPIILQPFRVAGVFEDELQARLHDHYINSFWRHLLSIMRSTDLGKGIWEFFDEPTQGLQSGGGDFFRGIGKGSKSLVKHTILGGIFGTTSKAAGLLGTGINSMIYDEETRKQCERAAVERPKHAADGMLKGGMSFGKSLVRGLSGIVEDPIKGAQRGGSRGFMKGMARGLVGVVAKPTAGVLDFVSSTAEGVKNMGSYLDDLPPQRRTRPPRVFSEDGLLTRYDEVLAEGQLLLATVQGGRYRDHRVARHILPSAASPNRVLVTPTALFVLTPSDDLLKMIKLGRIRSNQITRQGLLIRARTNSMLDSLRNQDSEDMMLPLAPGDAEALKEFIATTRQTMYCGNTIR